MELYTSRLMGHIAWGILRTTSDRGILQGRSRLQHRADCTFLVLLVRCTDCLHHHNHLCLYMGDRAWGCVVGASAYRCWWLGHNVHQVRTLRLLYRIHPDRLSVQVCRQCVTDFALVGSCIVSLSGSNWRLCMFVSIMHDCNRPERLAA